MHKIPSSFFFFCAILPFLKSCTTSTSSFISSSASITLPALSPEEEIISGVNYGRLYAFTDSLWMLKQFSIAKSVSKLTNECPSGWLPPTNDDIKALFQYASGKTILTDSNIFNMKTNLILASNTKKFPTNTDGSTAEAYVYYGIKFKADGTPLLGEFNSYFDNSLVKIFCIHGSKTLNNPLSTTSSLNLIKPKRDLIKGIKYTFNVDNTNIVENEWTVKNEVLNSKTLNLIPMLAGSYDISVKSKLFDGTIIGACSSLWVRDYFGSEAATSLSKSDIKTVKFADKTINRVTGFHFSSGSAPIAPKKDGGAFIIYSAKVSNNLFVKIIDNEGVQQEEIDLGKTGFPFDIVGIDCGFVALIKDSPNLNTLYLLAMNVCTKTKIFERVIMNNGEKPSTFNSNQIVFYADAAGKPVFGMEAMYNPNNGKITVARDRIAILFAHYNNFDGLNNVHTGDTLITFDMKGVDEKLSFSWGASHSLAQSFIYDGQYLYGASLSDAYPLNIRFISSEFSESSSTPDPKTLLYNRLNNKAKSDLLPGIIPGNGAGLSSGRIGHLTCLEDLDKFILSYSRRKATTTFMGASKSSDVDEMGLVFFDKDFTNLNQVVLGKGTFINQIQSAKYGKNIFIAYVTSNRVQNDLLSASISNTDTMSFVLVDQDGKIVSGPFDYSTAFLAATDDMRILNDGRVAWTFVDENFNLNYYFLSKPEQTLTNFDLVKSTSFYKNNAEFYLIDSKDTNNYKTSPSSTNSNSGESGGGGGAAIISGSAALNGTYQIVHAASSKCLRFTGPAASSLILDDCDKAIDYSLSLFQVYNSQVGKYVNTDPTAQNSYLIIKPELATEYYFVKDLGLASSKASIFQASVVSSPPSTAIPPSFTNPINICYRAQIDVTDNGGTPNVQLAANPVEVGAGANCLKISGSTLTLASLVKGDAGFVWYFRPKTNLNPNDIRMDVSDKGDDLVSFVWRTNSNSLAQNSEIFLSIQGAIGTKVSGMCNSKYPFYSQVLFQKLYEKDSDATHPFIFAKVESSVAALLNCGVTTSALSSIDETIKYVGRVGFYSSSSNDGFFSEFSIESPANFMANLNYIDSPDSFVWYYDKSIDVIPNFQTQIRFYSNGTEQNVELTSLQKIILNLTLINAELNYIFKSMTLYLLDQKDKSDYERGPGILYPYWTPISSAGPIKYNTQEYLVDLKNAPTGKYKFLIKYELQLATSRLLKEVDEEEDDEEIYFQVLSEERKNVDSSFSKDNQKAFVIIIGLIISLLY